MLKAVLCQAAEHATPGLLHSPRCNPAIAPGAEQGGGHPGPTARSYRSQAPLRPTYAMPREDVQPPVV